MGLLFSFKGRIGRQQYWLGTIGISAIFGILFALAGAMMGPQQEGQPLTTAAIVGLVAMVPMVIVFFWVTLALSIKRGHDRGRSAWWQLLGLVPLANIWLGIDQAFLRGIDATNQWGAPSVPREATV